MSDKEKEERPSLLYRVGEDWPAGIVGFISIALVYPGTSTRIVW